MNAIPEKIQALTQLLTDAAPAVASQGYDLEDLAHRLLQNGVDVTLPEPCRCHPYGEPPYGTEGQVDCPIHGESAPAPQLGDVAIATVRGVEGVIVARGRVLGGQERWIILDASVAYEHPILSRFPPDDQVTVTSRAAVVTEGDRDRLVDDLANWLGAEHVVNLVDDLANWLGAEHVVNRWFAAQLGGGQ